VNAIAETFRPARVHVTGCALGTETLTGHARRRGDWVDFVGEGIPGPDGLYASFPVRRVSRVDWLPAGPRATPKEPVRR
jgi:hypothetical protein